jgi:hypothetical protein
LDEIFTHYNEKGRELAQAVRLFDIGRIKN